MSSASVFFITFSATSIWFHFPRNTFALVMAIITIQNYTWHWFTHNPPMPIEEPNSTLLSMVSGLRVGHLLSWDIGVCARNPSSSWSPLCLLMHLWNIVIIAIGVFWNMSSNLVSLGRVNVDQHIPRVSIKNLWLASTFRSWTWSRSWSLSLASSFFDCHLRVSSNGVI